MNSVRIKGKQNNIKKLRKFAICLEIIWIYLLRLMLANGELNVRKSLKTQFMSNGTATGAGANGLPRKTLMHKLSEGAMELNDSKEMVGFQNSQFNLKQIEANLARLGRIHLILEHLIMIKVNLNLENGKQNLKLKSLQM